MSEDKKEYDLKMQEYAQLLDIRADRIRVNITSTHSLTKLLVVVVCLFVLFICLFVFRSFHWFYNLRSWFLLWDSKVELSLKLKTARHGGVMYKVSSVFHSVPLKSYNSLRFTYITIFYCQFIKKKLVYNFQDFSTYFSKGFNSIEYLWRPLRYQPPFRTSYSTPEWQDLSISN